VTIYSLCPDCGTPGLTPTGYCDRCIAVRMAERWADDDVNARMSARSLGLWLMPDGTLGPPIVPGAPMPADVVDALRADGKSDERIAKLCAKAGAKCSSPAAVVPM
jgi:hypothetical protein